MASLPTAPNVSLAPSIALTELWARQAKVTLKWPQAPLLLPAVLCHRKECLSLDGVSPSSCLHAAALRCPRGFLQSMTVVMRASTH